MRVFSIEGKFRLRFWYDKLPGIFKGYFVLEKSGQIKGYMEEQLSSRYDSERYIHGKYDEANNNLVYLMMSTERELFPVLYCFPNLKRDGAGQYLILGMEVSFLLDRLKELLKRQSRKKQQRVLMKFSPDTTRLLMMLGVLI